MFWRFGTYANVSTLDTILDKPDVTLEELLDESDLIQELKQHNTKLIEYLRDENVLRRLLEYVVAPPLYNPESEDDDMEEEEEPPAPKKSAFSPVRSLSLGRSKEDKARSKRQEEREELEKADKTRQKYAYTACEVLASETWSIIEALMDNQQHLRQFWQFVKCEAPLDPVAAGYFTKINETLLDKKTEETLDFVKSLDGIIPAMLQHVDCPMVMDLLLKIISMEKAEGGQGIVDWLHGQNLIPLLLAYLGRDYPTFTQTSAGDFIKAIITISANASQNEQSCIGPNSLTRQLVSEPCIESLITDMLRGGNPLTVGVGIVIEVIRKNNSDYDPDVGAGQDLAPSSSDPIYLGTLLRLFAKHVPDFTELILSPNHTVTSGDRTITIKRKELKVAFGTSIEPLGFDRFKTCELMAELLHCSNMGLLNEKGSEAFVKQRDLERERLKAEGSLMKTREPQSAITEFSEDSTGYQNGGSSPLGLGSGSPEEIRRLEVANSAEDDGFEDVGASGDLSEEIKDDFDEKSPFELESTVAQSSSATKSTRPRLDLDEEFVDEPLTSPQLKPVDDHEADAAARPEPLDVSKHYPTSPTSELTSKVGGLSLGGPGDASHAQHNDSLGGASTTTEKATDNLFWSFPSRESGSDDGSHLPTEVHTPHSDAPPLPHRDRSLSSGTETPDDSSPRGISPHPDDKPAPLFAARSESTINQGDAPAQSSEATTEASGSQESIDTTLGDGGDSTQSALLENEPTSAPHIEADVDGRPIVGDYLKMMFVEHKVVPTILDFFFRFPWNNFLHNVVYDVVQQVFNGPMDRGFNRSLAIDLFQTGRITERIIEGQLRSDEAQARNNMRLGYMGHLTLIAEEVVKFSERHPAELLSPAVLDRVTDKLWSDYVEYKLAETRERDAAILGGVRPDLALGPRQAVLNAVNAAHNFGNGGSNALVNAGLNGGSGLDSMDLTSSNAGSGTGSLGLGGGSLLSGFGSSSDEEDEEMEEIGEHEDHGEVSSDQYPSYTPSSLSALSIFSPPLDSPAGSSSDANPAPLPPPLNIPPSRARRQLAARLALHGKGGSPFASPQVSPNEGDGSGQASLNSILAGAGTVTSPSSSSTALSSATGDEKPTPVSATPLARSPEEVNRAASVVAASLVAAGGGTAAESKLVHQAILSQKSETPFGDLADLEGMGVSLQERRWAGDWVDFDDDGEVEEEEGEDVPITMAVDYRRGRGDGEKEGERGVAREVGGKEKEEEEVEGSSEEGSGSNSSDDEGARVGLREAKKRSLLEDEEE